jgi:hypothetical protein
MFLENTVRDVLSVMSYVMCSFYVYIYNVTTRHVSVGGRDLTVDLPRHMSSLWLPRERKHHFEEVDGFV